MVDAGFYAKALQEGIKKALALVDKHHATLAAREHSAQSARALVVDAVREWHRHTARNWIVLRQIVAEMDDGAGIPLECHIEKLRYLDHRLVFEHDRLFVLPEATRRLVYELQPIIRNANAEIDELIRAVRSGKAERVADAAGLVLRKFQFLFVTKLPSIVAPEERADWIVDDDIAAACAACAAELADRPAREDIVYRRPEDEE